MIRVATLADLPAVLTIEQASFGAHAWSESQLRDDVTGPREVLVEAAPQVRGFAIWGPAGDDSEVLSAAGAVNLHGVMLLEVAADNEPAVALYTAAGFGPLSRRRAYYPNGVDALVLSRKLGQ